MKTELTKDELRELIGGRANAETMDSNSEINKKNINSVCGCGCPYPNQNAIRNINEVEKCTCFCI